MSLPCRQVAIARCAQIRWFDRWRGTGQGAGLRVILRLLESEGGCAYAEGVAGL